jgi:hypothetical protein
MELRPNASGAGWTPFVTGKRTRRSVTGLRSVLFGIGLTSHLHRALICAVFALAVCASPGRADTGTDVPGPTGVFAKVDIETAIKAVTKTYKENNHGHEPTTAELHTLLQQLYGDLLANQAVSGLVAGTNWDHIQLSDPSGPSGVACDPYGYTPSGCDWSYLDDVFEVARLADVPLHIQITPGFDSPQWLLSKIPSCDGLFDPKKAPSVAADCGKVTFTYFPEISHTDANEDGHYVLPLPWNPVYQHAWWSFLKLFAQRYNPGLGSSADSPLAAVSIAGPVSVSPEIIFPTSANNSTLPSGMDVDDAWTILIQHSVPPNVTEPHNYAQTDEVFVRWWKHAIDQYEWIFTGLTLVLTPDASNDLPEFTNNRWQKSPFTSPVYPVDCSKSKTPRSCEAKAEIISYFIAATGPNRKATLVGGLTAASDTAFGDIGMPGVRLVTSLSPPFGPPAIFGGAEVDHPISGSEQLRQETGCPTDKAPDKKQCKGLTQEEAEADVLYDFFYGTPAAAHFLQAPQFAGSGGVGNEQGTVEFLWVPYLDILYATANKCLDEKKILRGDTSVQDQLDSASYYLQMMAYQPEPQLPPACVISSGP